MPYAINYRSDNNSSDSTRRLWTECATLYPPHLTFAIYDEIQQEELFAGFAAAVECLGSLTIRFESLGIFERPYGIILWAASVLPKPIFDAHAEIHGTVNRDQCRSNYRPGNCVPDCSLATAISKERKDEAIAFAERSIEPIELTFDAADCASIIPVWVLKEANYAE